MCFLYFILKMIEPKKIKGNKKKAMENKNKEEQKEVSCNGNLSLLQ